ncbi:MAG: type II toxin-antitoxin system RelE/ParE family toxin [Salinimicrobium sediminis]|nr:type II toxin-antitoxin system RelE/ParE family toxin [Salinimicrobium sediminis]
MKILQYWQKRNKSKVYSQKLFKLFQVSVRQISENPTIGKPTSINEIRSYVLRDYLIFYEILNNHILILTIWDSRQNPTKLRL